MQLKDLTTAEEIATSFEAFLELRPFLTDKPSFVKKVLNQQKEGYKVVAILEGDEVVACMGFRIFTMLCWGKILYLDDLVTKEKSRNKGYGKALLDHATHLAQQNECDQIHLDTGYTRHTAHKVYLNQGFEFHCHHLALKLK